MHTSRAPMLVSAAALALAACSTTYADQHTDSAAVATSAATPQVVVVKTSDFAFQAPDSIRAGLTTIRLETNPGPELHQVGLIRLDSGKTAADLFETMKTAPALPRWASEIAGVNPPAPGKVAEATVNLQPGSYLLVCFVPSADGVPHIAKGMSRALTVTGASVAATRLPADVEMKLVDYGFVLSTPLTSGAHVVRVVNAAQQTHEVVFVRLAPGKTAADLASWVEKQQGPPPAEPLGGVAGLGVGQAASFPVTLTPGEYALLCFVPDAKDGKPHVAHGMVKPFTV
ncbi:MAG: hypothetical protein HOQ09_12275, partial [Gemmatimonadaceae bacterium]|nr:hypothetical protein [Gemmatimonadaceae bacterium]